MNQQKCWNERTEHNEDSFLYCRKNLTENRLDQQNFAEKAGISEKNPTITTAVSTVHLLFEFKLNFHLFIDYKK